MKEYKGVRYEQNSNGWKIIWPSGISSYSSAENEEDLKKQIDDIASQATK